MPARSTDSDVYRARVHREPQVRFSIPDPDDTDRIVFPNTSTGDSDESQVQEPEQEQDTTRQGQRQRQRQSKQVDNRGHLVDMHSKIMIDVPEDIWKFHRSHRKSKSLEGDSSSGSIVLGHKKSKSLQSIILETVSSYQDYSRDTSTGDISSSTNNSSLSQVSPLHLGPQTMMTPTKNASSNSLYLSSESPLNKYKVPVPAMISLPPFLSPENKHKKSNSVVYNGSGYSAYNYDGDTSSEYTGDHTQTSTDDSIPSAKFDISFDPGAQSAQETDHILGIDEDANVNLKVQNRNLRMKSLHNQIPTMVHEKSSPSRQSSPVAPILKTNHQLPIPNQQSATVPILKNNEKSPMSNQPSPVVPILKHNHKRELSMPSPQNYQFPTSHSNSEQQTILNKDIAKESKSLQILSTPSKTIDIPDLSKMTTPASASSRGSLHFFDRFDDSKDDENFVPANINRVDQLDLSFKFPASNTQHAEIAPVLNPIEDSDFLKVDTSPTNPQFEKRRQMLMDQNRNSAMSHQHRRSRSVHNTEDIQDLFEATSTPPKTSKEQSVPTRSPLRPKSPTLTDNLPSYDPNPDVIPDIKVTESPEDDSVNSIQDSITKVTDPHYIEDTQDSYQYVGVHDISTSSTIENSSEYDSTPTEITIEGTENILRQPLTTFASFSAPLNLDGINQTMNENGKLGSLPSNGIMLDQNIMSNTGSVSSRTSIFSKNSGETALTSNPSTYDQEHNNINPTSASIMIKAKKNSHRSPIFEKPQTQKHINNKDDAELKTVFEKINGKIVEVITIDDDVDETSKISVKVPLQSNGHKLDNMIDDYNDQVRMRRNKSNDCTKKHRQSFHEAQKKYETILSLCDETAETAKTVIYELNKKQHSETKGLAIRAYNSANTANNITSNISNMSANELDPRKIKYLSTFNKKLRVNSYTRKEKPTTG
ncbi:hypothetical protein J7295_00523 [Nakaseomyces glabratus]|nr:hypothetical protein J7298_00522 [Nakaseomyces glabratus]KAH7607837.1 hypothetical protein J7295_00523 [Nakaseomyces glabratus]